jgi:site-specific recombinase XerD
MNAQQNKEIGMTGRFIGEKEIEARVDEKVNGMPDYVGRWYLNLKAGRKTAATCRDYISKVNRFLSSINKDVKNVKLEDITETAVTKYFLSIQTKRKNHELRYTSDSYQDGVWCCLDNFLEYLYGSGLIERNYIRRIDKPKNRDLERINERRVLLTEGDFKKILDAVDVEKREFIRERDYAILLVFMTTGMRETALTEIMIRDFNYVDKTLSIIDKGGKRHVYNLTEKTYLAIFDWLTVKEPNPLINYLFVSSNGTKMHVNTVANVVKKYSKLALGHEISPHKLRAGYCSILYNKTGDIEFVRRAVGHSNVATTQRYIVTKGAEKEKAAEIMGSIL